MSRLCDTLVGMAQTSSTKTAAELLTEERNAAENRLDEIRHEQHQNTQERARLEREREALVKKRDALAAAIEAVEAADKAIPS